ncbi:transcriptional regulator FeaR [Polaromonas hydrogenivorans]|uniref:Transcriptional regulator FeaR n=1 Tax=Polaromonas hydrogenivorans TaxID=335476 RepID=A0AAU7LTC0_9BURK
MKYSVNTPLALVDSPFQDQRVGFDEWLARINKACGAFSATMLGDTFIGALDDYQGSAVRLSVVDAIQTRLYRTQKDVGRSDDQKYFAILQLRGQAAVEQGDQRARLDRGDLTILDAARPCSALLGDQSRQISLILPRQMVERNMHQTRVACAQRLPATSPLGIIAGRLMLAASQQSKKGLGQQESEAILDALITLLKPAIGLADAQDDTHERMFRKACEFIELHLASEDLSPEWIAQSIGVSVRGLYRVFSRQGLVVAQYIKHRRLDLCAEALRHPSGSEKLSSLGYSWGFADSSHFSSAFKTRFGMPPGEYRRRYLHPT